MIKARVLSTTMSAKPDAPIEVNMEMWVFNGSLSCPDEVIIIMTEEEYKALDSVSDVLRNWLLDERKKTKELQEEEKSLRKELSEKEVEICRLTTDNNIEQECLRARIKELNEEVEKLKRENTELEAKNTDIRYDRTIINQDNTRLRGIVKEQSETIQKLEEENMSIKEDIRNLEKRMAQDAEEIYLHPDGTVVFRKKRISELEKEVEKQEEKIMKLETENSDLKEKIETITRLLTPVRYDH